MSQLRLVRPPAGRTRAVAPSPDGPIGSEFFVVGRLFRLDSWTQQQWERLPVDRRPESPWRHGDLIVTIRSR